MVAGAHVGSPLGSGRAEANRERAFSARNRSRGCSRAFDVMNVSIVCRQPSREQQTSFSFAERPAAVTTSTLHIVFSDPASESLKKALHNAGRTDRVVCNNFDNLALGPIDPPDLKTRLHWMEEELRCSGWEWVHAEEEAFWKAALAEDVRRVAWMSR